MRSKVTLYFNAQILPENNFEVEDIETYLSTLESVEKSDYNYFKFDKINPVLKIELSQLYMENEQANNINYVKIQNYGVDDHYQGKFYYFFVQEKRWKSENCIELQLYLDSVNTFQFSSFKNYLRDTTTVTREHKDRFEFVNNSDDEELIFEQTFTGAVDTYDSTLGKYTTTITFFSEALVDNHIGYTIIDIAPSGNAQFTYEDDGNASVKLIGDTLNQEVTATISVYYYLMMTQPTRIIDDFPEGINPSLYKGDEVIINDKDNMSWNLIYKNSDAINPDNFNQVNPVECFLCGDNEIMASGLNQYTLTISNFTDNLYYFTSPCQLYDENTNTYPTLKFETSNNEVITLTYQNVYYEYDPLSIKEKVIYYLAIRKLANATTFTAVLYKYTWYQAQIPSTLEVINVYNNLTSLKILDKYPYLEKSTNDFNPLASNKTDVIYGTDYEEQVIGLNSIDRTDSKLIKIIKTPYCPNNYEVEVDQYAQQKLKFPTNWKYDVSSHLLKLDDLNSKFKNVIKSESTKGNGFKNTIFDRALFIENMTQGNPNFVKDINLESKLYSSEFYYQKFIYDSFGYQFDMERIDMIPYLMSKLIDDNYFEIDFIHSTTISSKFLFKFPQYIVKKFKGLLDYEGILNVARNNEIALYTNQYINYLRTGYNYDLKNKNRAEATSGITSALSLIGAISSTSIGVVSGNPALAITSTIAGVNSIASTIMGGINSIIASENNIASKMEQLKAQATNVSGSDDVDLLEEYSNNKAKIAEYSVSDRMRQQLYDFFFYCGYATNEQKALIINDSRYWFNFLQADLSFKNNVGIVKFALDDLKNRYKIGITFLHHHTDEGLDVNWDFNQVKENWETWYVDMWRRNNENN